MGETTAEKVLILLAVLASAVSAETGWAQEQGDGSVLSVFRQQARSISKDVLQALGPTLPQEVSLRVEEAPLPSVIEFSFLEELSKRGITVRTDLAKDDERLLSLLVLRQKATFDSLSPGTYLRIATTMIEGRYTGAEGEPLRYLGSFERTDRDSVGVVEQMPWTRPLTSSEEESSVVSRIAAPLVIITGAALIVYLFFAVRSS